MWFPSLFAAQPSRRPGNQRPRWPGNRRGVARPTVRPLEDRTLLSSYTAATASALIADINAANQAGGSNTIALTAPTTAPYVFTAVDNTTDGASGLPVIAKRDTLTIIGNGDTIERSTASGTPDFRLFDVASGAALTLENLTLQNGLAFGSGSAAEGGAIFNHGTLILSGVTVQSNTAQGSNGANAAGDGADASGGGVWSGSALTLENATLVQNNQAIGGGGVGGKSFAKTGVGGNAFGGGVFVAGGSANITGDTVDDNVTTGGPGGSFFRLDGYIFATAGNGSGGGVYIAAGTVTLSSDTVDGNQAEGGTNPGFQSDGNAYGGGICLAAGTVTLSNDTVAGNSATANLLGASFPQAAGGGVYVASAATATLCNDTVESNSATTPSVVGGNPSGAGGGIYIASGAAVYLDSFTVANSITNTDNSGTNGSTANIVGPYTLQNC
jgi:hypothetical protein